ncbi:membrane protein [Carnobacterium viridans]|uniref:Membrane protein n=1 Tax=Carnobacterium viridans TaxID=174587 RepID=A0A1H1AT49_9LACT|nr:membrane protein [Carnobacterium viridans]
MSTNAKSASFKDRFKHFLEVLKPNWARAEVSSNAAELAYFTLLSLFPILLVVANVIPLFPIDAADILPMVETAVPPDIYNVLAPILESYLNSSSGGAISIGLITSLWSASKAFNALQNVLNDVYGVEKRNNFIIVRLVSFLVQLAIVAIVGVLIFVFVFGEFILLFIEDFVGIELDFILQIFSLKWLVLFIVLILIITMVYFLVPNHRMHIKYALPGAVFATIGWMVLSQAFTLYVQFAGGEAAASATFGVFIVLMLWLYLSAIILLLGALINAVYFEIKTGKSVQEVKIEKDNEEKDDKEKEYPDDSESIQHKKLVKLKTVEKHKED